LKPQFGAFLFCAGMLLKSTLAAYFQINISKPFCQRFYEPQDLNAKYAENSPGTAESLIVEFLCGTLLNTSRFSAVTYFVSAKRH
jgi:hypothetical protein